MALQLSPDGGKTHYPPPPAAVPGSAAVQLHGTGVSGVGRGEPVEPIIGRAQVILAVQPTTGTYVKRCHC